MRIAQVCPLVFPVPSGSHGVTERVVGNLTEELVEMGHDVTLFAAGGSQTSARLEPQGAALSQSPGAPASMAQVNECVMLDRVAAMADRFDVIHCHTSHYHAVALREHVHKLVQTLHERADQMGTRDFLQHFADVPTVAISSAQARDVPDRNLMGVVHPGLDPLKFRASAGRGGYAAFLGRMGEARRPDRAVELAKRCRLPLKMAGAMAGDTDMYERRVAPQLNRSLEYIGPVTDVQKQLLLGNAEVLFVTGEGVRPFELAMVEAMACGTPVVAWRGGSVAEIVEPGVTGFVVDDMAQAVAAVAQARTLDRRAIRAAFDRRFTSRDMARNYETIYREIITERRAA